ncbi:hypothetical protein CHELA40_12956 [Chelatococcus asaccharovorans]|nr:hypothetical protein CHELA40_12956 [Chelatococcus asaccharovorans]CAH1681075.1 hypothetical protein CHELA17_62663 [Chelatococcus asaccharovorans]
MHSPSNLPPGQSQGQSQPNIILKINMLTEFPAIPPIAPHGARDLAALRAKLRYPLTLLLSKWHGPMSVGIGMSKFELDYKA